MRGERAPRLDLILVGDDFGSIKYVKMKEKNSKRVRNYLSNTSFTGGYFYKRGCKSSKSIK